MVGILIILRYLYYMQKQVVVFVGPPGSGKDTQAERLVDELGFVQVPSSKIIRAKFAENQNDPVIQEEKRKFDVGLLNDAVLVAQWIMEFVRPLAMEGKSQVFSGSPRTPHEAEVEYPALQELYGPEYVMVIYLDIDLDEMKTRIAGRRFCKANGHVIAGSPEFAHLTVCPQDGSELFQRPLDDASLVETRYNEFKTLTLPVVEIAKEYGVPVYMLDGKKSIESLHHDIVALIERHHLPPPQE